MWLKMTPEEARDVSDRRKQRERRAVVLLVALFWLVVWLALAVLSARAIGAPPHRTVYAWNSRAFWNRLLITAPVSAVLCFAAAWTTARRTTRQDRLRRETAMICPRCGVVESTTDKVQCACGAQLENAANWKWVEDGSAS
jgi:hypothetical protein